MRSQSHLLALAFTLSLLAAARTPAPDGLVSPEVHADRTVTFRVRAPLATVVTRYGDWMPVGTPEGMTKSADGVWTNGHLYWFNLDGLAVADPVNPRVKLGTSRSFRKLYIVWGGRKNCADRDPGGESRYAEIAH